MCYIYIYINPHGGPIVSTTGITRAVVCDLVHMNESLLLIGKSTLYIGGSGFPLSHLSGILPYV